MSEELPKGWVEVTLNDIADWSSGGTPKATEPKYYDGDIPWLIIADLNNSTVTNSAKKITQIGLQNSSAKWVEIGSVLIAMYGSIGKLGIAGIRCTTNQAIAFTTKIWGQIPNHFLFYYLKYNEPELLKVGQGGAQKNISQTILKEYPFILPPLNEQKRIVAKLDAIMPRIEAVKARLDKVPGILKRFRQSVLTAAVTGKLTEQWREEHPEVESAEDNFFRNYKESNARKLNYNRSLKSDMPLQDVPSEWFWIKLSQTGDMGRGKSKHRPRNAPHLYGGEYPFIQTGDVANSNGLIQNHKQTYSDEGLKQSKLWPSNTICITIAANIADSAILTYPACFPDSVVGIIVNEKNCEIRFVEFFIRTIRENLSLFAPATAQKNINLTILNDIMFPLPPLEEQKEIVRQVDKLFALADKVEAHYKKAKARVDKLSQSVLAKAFRGELVPQDPNDEPAEKLLERILKEKERLSQGTQRTRGKKK